MVAEWVVWARGLVVVLALVVAVTLLLLAALSWWGARHWARVSQATLAALEATRLPATAARYDAHEIEGLPAPVQRYFRAVLKDGQRIVTAVSLRHSGSMNLSIRGARWFRFSSSQRVLTRRPGFVWNARLVLVPGIAVCVHDACIGGQGSLLPALLGLIPLGRQQGGGEIARGELMRWFAEGVWYPTALLPSQGVTWTAVDNHSALATLVDGSISLTLLFNFDAQGFVTTVLSESRAARVDGRAVMLPWMCSLSNYQQRDGMWVPMSGEAATVVDGEPRGYWRGHLEALSYEFAGQGA